MNTVTPIEVLDTEEYFLTNTEGVKNLKQALSDAFTASAGPTQQSSGCEHDPDKYEIIGKVPIPVRILHNYSNWLANEIHFSISAYKNPKIGLAEKKELKKYLDSVSPSLISIEDAKWSLLREEAGNTGCNKGLSILKDWKIGKNLTREKADGSNDKSEQFSEVITAIKGTLSSSVQPVKPFSW